MYCIKCGAQIDDNSLFCSICGEKINVNMEGFKKIIKEMYALMHKYYIERQKGLTLDELENKYREVDDAIRNYNKYAPMFNASVINETPNSNYPFEKIILNIGQRLENEKKKQVSEAEYYITYDSISSLNSFLANTEGIKKISCEPYMKKAFGFIAPKWDLDYISVKYTQTNMKYDFIYQVAFFEKAQIFKGVGDLERTIRELNPSKEIIRCYIKKVSLAHDTFSHIMEKGSYIERAGCLILWRQNRGDMTPLNLPGKVGFF